MGRTNPTYRDRLRAQEQAWSDYRRVLRRSEREHFDALWTAARAHADAAGFQNPGDPMDAILVSICLEQQQTISRLERRLAALEPAEDDVQD